MNTLRLAREALLCAAWAAALLLADWIWLYYRYGYHREGRARERFEEVRTALAAHGIEVPALTVQDAEAESGDGIPF